MTQNNIISAETDKDIVSLKGFIVSIQQWMRYLWRNWIIILVVVIVLAGLGALYASMQKTKYTAVLKFVLEDSKSSSLGGYAGLASQFGLDLGGSGGSGVFTGDNILEFLRSRIIIEKTLLSSIDLGGRRITLADLYLQINAKKGTTKAVNNFPPDANRKTFSRMQDSILTNLFQTIITANLNVQKPDKKLSFIVVRCKSTNEIFSRVFTERLMQEATDFYISTKLQRSKINVDKLEAKADSIEHLLNLKSYAVARNKDINLNPNPSRQVGTVGIELASIDKMILQTMYGEVIKNLELSKMTMEQETPIIQIVESPTFPLLKEKFSLLKGLVIGGFFGGLFAVLWLTLRRLYKLALK